MTGALRSSSARRVPVSGGAGHNDLSSERPTGPRVLMVTPRYFPFAGGVETHVYEVARRLVPLGADVTVLTTDPSGELPKREILQGVKVVRTRAYPNVEDFYFAPGVVSTIVRGGWDVVHCQGIHTFVPPVGMLAARRAAIPYVVTFHTGGHSSGMRHRLRALQWYALRPLLAHAARLIGVSRFEADLFREQLHLDPSLFTVIPNGSNLPEVDGQASEAEDENSLILSVGRLEKYKGHHRVIAALPHVLEERPNARLRIVGTGPYEKTLHLMSREFGVADRVEIGSVAATNRLGMSSVLSQASLVTLMSEYEAHPIAVMEALSLKRPVLAADTSGLRELAQKGLISSIPLDSTPKELAQAILRELGQSRAASTVELPTWDQCAASLLSLYQDVARKTGATL